MNTPRFEAPRLVSLPRTRRLSWVPTTLEFLHQIVLACWMGGILVMGMFVTPQLRNVIDDSRDAAWAALDLSMQLNFVSAGAGSFLLLVALVMYLLALRSQKATFLEIGLLLTMTSAAVASHVLVGPHIAEILRAFPDLGLADGETRSRLDNLGAWNVFLTGIQFVVGAIALAPGVRRWYQYVSPQSTGEELFLVAVDGE